MATMSAGWHRAADSVAAFLVVGFWATLAAIVVRLAAPPSGPADPSSARIRWFGPATVGGLVLGVALTLFLDATASFRDSTVGQTVALLASACFIAGSAAGVLLVTLRILEVIETPVGAASAREDPYA
jgi:hypothetical protein